MFSIRGLLEVFFPAVLVDGEIVPEQEVGHLAELPERLDPDLVEVDEAEEVLVARPGERDAGLRELVLDEREELGDGFFMMYSPFSHLSFWMSNLAWTSFIWSMSKIRTASARVMISCSSPGSSPGG